MEPKPPAESCPTSCDDFRNLVLDIITELSPCSESKLFIVAATRGVERFGDGSLSDLNLLLSQCVQALQERKLVEIKGGQLVIAPAGRAGDEDVLDMKTECVGSAADEDILDLTVELVGSTEDEGILDLTAELVSSAEDEGILDLTVELVGSTEDEGILDLTAELVSSAEDEGILDLTAELVGSAEDEGILDLTTEFELLPSKPAKNLTNQQKANLDDARQDPRTETIQTQAQVTGNPRRTPEPTRGEIIAAMRQFISDDQTGKEPAPKDNAASRKAS